MIKSLLLVNFQAHKNLEIEFSPTVTSIVGPSDVGKSSVIRSLRWVFLNEGLGGLTRHGTKKTIVKVNVDGKRICRKRIGKSNAYSFSGRHYAAIRRDVPGAVQNHLRIGRLNFQGQHDAPYWLSDSGGSVSRELNNIIDLGVIDRTLAAIASGLRQSNVVYKVIRQRQREASQEAKDLEWVQGAEEAFKELEEKEKALTDLSRQSLDLECVVNELDATNAILVNNSQRRQQAQKLLSKAKEAVRAGKRLKGLENVLQQATEAARQARLQPPSSHKLGFAIQHREDLESLITKIETEDHKLCEVHLLLERTSEQLKKQLKKRCPVCGQKITR